MQQQEADDGIQLPREAEGKARLLFWGSLLLSMLIIVHMVLLIRGSEHLSKVVTLFLTALLAWSFIVSAHAFQLLSRILQHKQGSPERFTDRHTGVFTLEYLTSCLKLEDARAVESGVSATVLYVDLEKLEKVNDQFGYTVGDIALKSLAELMGEKMRSGDILGRVGGDEFLIIMPETTLKQARGVAEEIRKAVDAYELDLGKRGTIDYLDCRTGLAVFPADGETPEDIISAARQNTTQVVV